MENSSRKDRVINLKIIDNVGDTDGIDLFSLSDDEFSKLEDEIFKYASNRTKAWEMAYKKKHDKN